MKYLVLVLAFFIGFSIAEKQKQKEKELNKPVVSCSSLDVADGDK